MSGFESNASKTTHSTVFRVGNSAFTQRFVLKYTGPEWSKILSSALGCEAPFTGDAFKVDSVLCSDFRLLGRFLSLGSFFWLFFFLRRLVILGLLLGLLLLRCLCSELFSRWCSGSRSTNEIFYIATLFFWQVSHFILVSGVVLTKSVLNILRQEFQLPRSIFSCSFTSAIGQSLQENSIFSRRGFSGFQEVKPAAFLCCFILVAIEDITRCFWSCNSVFVGRRQSTGLLRRSLLGGGSCRSLSLFLAS